MHYQSGFTLIELLIAIAVAAIVLSLGVPSFERIIERNQLTANVNKLVTTLNLARSEAIKRNQRVKICDSTDGANCGAGNYEQGWIVFVDENNNGVLDNPNEELIQVYEALPTNFTINPNLTLGVNDVSFQTNGRANRGGNFILCKNNDVTKAKVIILDMNGRARVTDYAPDGTPFDASGNPIASC